MSMDKRTIDYYFLKFLIHDLNKNSKPNFPNIKLLSLKSSGVLKKSLVGSHLSPKMISPEIGVRS